jgi:hypothetical protein
MDGSAKQVAEWYASVSGYRFSPTVVGQLYARRGMKPITTGYGVKVYSGRAILNDLDDLRRSREGGNDDVATD